MKIKVQVNDEEKEITLKMKGKHQEIVINKFMEMTAADNPEEVIKSFWSTMKDIAKKITNLKEEDFEEIDVDDLNVIYNEIQKKALGSLDFLKSSLQLEN